MRNGRRYHAVNAAQRPDGSDSAERRQPAADERHRVKRKAFRGDGRCAVDDAGCDMNFEASRAGGACHR
jgi:hypothetical protein